MRCCLLINARSGAGRGAAAGASIARALREAGAEVDEVHLTGDPCGPALEAALRSADGLIVVGGDGTVHSALVPLLAAVAGGPAPWLYHAPSGTENLFARHFAMPAEPAAVAAAALAGRTRSIDLGLCTFEGSPARPFALMASAGPDASIVHRRSTGRERGGHSTYVLPIAREIACPHLAHVSIRVDGRTVVDHARGLLVVGNCPRYAMGHDPCRRADMSDGLLDAVFFPASGRMALWRWARLARAGAHLDDHRLSYSRGRTIEVIPCSGPVRWQIDGEPVRHAPTAPAPTARLSALPAAISILLPAQDADRTGQDAPMRPV